MRRSTSSGRAAFRVAYEDVEHVHVMRNFLADPARILRILMQS